MLLVAIVITYSIDSRPGLSLGVIHKSLKRYLATESSLFEAFFSKVSSKNSQDNIKYIF